MSSGRCLCGDVRWQVDAAYTTMTHCHCAMCRKTHGTAFATYCSAPLDALNWLAGASGIVRYRSSPAGERAFCGHCGSVVPTEAPEEGRVHVPAGCIDGDPGIRPTAHIFTASRAPWYAISDALPRYDTWTPGDERPVFDTAPPPPAPPGVVRGSCLCGDVAFRVTAPFRFAHHCHCSRCRRARAAAHASNAFATYEGLEFERGAPGLLSYKPPEALRFTQVFCARCGSAMPNASRERGVAVVPMGCLDDPPGHDVDDHIYVDYKAPWFEITDTLPRYPEAPPPA